MSIAVKNHPRRPPVKLLTERRFATFERPKRGAAGYVRGPDVKERCVSLAGKDDLKRERVLITQRNHPDFLKILTSSLFDWPAILAGVRIVYLGEVHGGIAHLKELARMMPQFQAQGFTHFGAELFRSTVEEQRILSDYFAQPTPAHEDAVKRLIYRSSFWGAPALQAYVDLVKAVVSARIQPFGLESSGNVAAANQVLSTEGCSRDFFVLRRVVNKRWAKVVEDLLQEATCKLLIHAGSLHGGYLANEKPLNLILQTRFPAMKGVVIHLREVEADVYRKHPGADRQAILTRDPKGEADYVFWLPGPFSS